VVPIAPFIVRAAELAPERVAVEAPDASPTYAELLDRARGIAGWLRGEGVVVGDRVAISTPAGAGFVAALHGCWLAGAEPVPLDARLGDAERAEQAAGAVLTVDEPQAAAADAAVDVRLHDDAATALVVHTSGTTAAPRAVESTFGNWAASARGAGEALGVEAHDRWLCALPLSHVGGLSILVRAAVTATTAVVHEGFDADAVARALRDGRITMVSLVATTLRRVLDAGLTSAPDLRCALIGGGPVPPALLARATQVGLPLAQTYGMTETCSMATVSAIGEPQTAGRALPGTSIRIAPDGEIQVAGPTVTPASAGPDGWLRTGDLGVVDEAGRLSVSGRGADTIVSGGENVAPAVVEAALCEHAAVAEAAVYGAPDAEWGEVVVATVVLRRGDTVTEDELRAHCRARLAGHQVPKRVAFATALPRTASGKLRRSAVADISVP
jgi:O-succinylbenzoic acid--CoA ligase